MPVAGKEETAVKPVSRMSVDYIASVPIKKRRYLLYATTSPPPDQQSSPPAEIDTLQKEQSSISPASTLSTASIGTSSSTLSDSNKNSGPEVRKGNPFATNGNVLQKASEHIKVKLEEPNLTMLSNSLDGMASSKKLLLADLSGKRPITSVNTKLPLESKESLMLDVRKVSNNKGKGEEKCSSDTSTITGNTELSLGLKENLIPSFRHQESNGSYLIQASLEPLSLNLSLNERKTDDQRKTNVVRSSTVNEKMPRSNWDLNTTMDAWEGPPRDAALDHSAPLGLSTGSGVLEVKPMICSLLRAGADKKEHRPNLTAVSTSTGRQCNSMDSLNLRLSPFLQSHFERERSIMPAKPEPSKVVSNISLPKVSVSASTPASVGRTIKPEPIDENVNQDPKRLRNDLMKPVDHNKPMKHELVERSYENNLKFSSLNPPMLVNPASVKSEAGDGNEDAFKKVEGTSDHPGKQVIGQDNHSSILRTISTSHLPCLPGKALCSTVITSGDVSNHSKSSNNSPVSCGNSQVPRESCSAEVAVRRVSVSEAHVSKNPNVSGTSEAETDEDKNANATEPKLIDQMPPCSRVNESASVSDEEKVNISGDMIEDDSYGSDYESDDNHAVEMAMDRERGGGGDDDYEDGEVRDPEVPTAKEGPLQEENVEHMNHREPDCKKITADASLGDKTSPTHVQEKDTRSEDPGGTNNNQTKKSDDVNNDEKPDKGTCKFALLQGSRAIHVPTSEPDNGRVLKRKLLDVSGEEDASEDPGMEHVSDEVGGRSQATATLGADDGEKKMDIEEKNDSAFSKIEASISADDGTLDVSSGGNRSRIINLSQTSNASAAGNVRSITNRTLPSRAEKDRFPDAAFDGEKLRPRGRDDIHLDGSPKFFRDRHQDQSSRNSRWNFTRGRGRGSGRFDTRRGEWNSGRDFDSEFYNGPRDIRIPRRKYTAPDADLEYNTYNMAPDSGLVGADRGGRKLIGDDDQIFRHLPSRRRSPGGRDGLPGRGLQMIQRGPRNVSPSRCIGDDGSELVALRRNEKFVRGFLDDNMDPGFSRTQHQYGGEDGHFVSGNRNFSGQRRGLPRIRSKSPVSSRTRSPGPWSSPHRRRSPDGFGGHPDMPRRRSPAVFRMDRMRSPERPCFPGDMVVRRQRSPPFLPGPNNDLRDMEPGREHGHPRGVITSRSPTDRALLRNNRRFDIVDPRERADVDEYFGAPLNSGRFHVVGGDGNGEDRRRFGERRGPVRSFRPPYDGENFPSNADDATRPFRFGPEDDSVFNERGNTRERDFEGRIKNRPGNAPRRTRNIEEQEVNFRNGHQEVSFRNSGPEVNFRNSGQGVNFRNSGPEGNFRNGGGQEGNFRKGTGQEGNFRNGSSGPEGNFRNSSSGPEGNFRKGVGQEGNFRKSAGQEVSFRKGAAQEGDFRKGAVQEGEFRNGGGQEGNFRNGGGGQEGNFRNGGGGQEGNFRNGGGQEGDLRNASGGQEGNLRNVSGGQEGNLRNISGGQEGNLRNISGQGGHLRNVSGQEGDFRNVNEQEGNLNGGQPWHDEGFDERAKRKRF